MSDDWKHDAIVALLERIARAVEKPPVNVVNYSAPVVQPNPYCDHVFVSTTGGDVCTRCGYHR